MKTFFIIYTERSGSFAQVNVLSDRQIVDLAFAELARIGQDFDSYYGPTTSPDEVLALSIEKLGDDGRMFLVYDDSSDFLEAAEHFGCGAAANREVDRYEL
jgi:hypothetical protein